VRRDGGDSELPDDYTFFYGNGNVNYELRTGFFIHEGIISIVKGV
jgi:hypothetical protein